MATAAAGSQVLPLRDQGKTLKGNTSLRSEFCKNAHCSGCTSLERFCSFEFNHCLDMNMQSMKSCCSCCLCIADMWALTVVLSGQDTAAGVF